ncbi:MAG: hypothetical protein ACUVWR_17230 [Anaerolineae bacterium]
MPCWGRSATDRQTAPGHGLWQEERRSDLVAYLAEQDLFRDAAFWKLAQALFEVLPRGEEDWKLISALLGERESLRQQALRERPALW